MEYPFRGSTALAAGAIGNKYQLRRGYRTIFPDIYLPDGVTPSLRQTTAGAWLWSRGQSVVAGPAAAALHGAKWVPDDTPVDLIAANPRAPQGIVTHRDSLGDGEITVIAGMSVTTAVRTAFDIGRWCHDETVARLDALGNATGFSPDEVRSLICRHLHVRHLRALEHALALYDPGAQSPQETWLRLLLIEAGFPRPQTQIPVLGPDGYPLYYLDMGWEEVKVAVEYDGEQHRLDREVYRRDLIRSEYVANQGWRRVRVIAGDRKAGIVRRVRDAWPLGVLPDRDLA